MEQPLADPTKDPILVGHRNEVLNDQVVRDYLSALDRKSVALVFSGGGGKGAYEAGVLLALYDCGLTRFCALAGTSVGALNAALFHELCRTADRNLVVKTWCDISPGKVLRATPITFVTNVAAKITLYCLTIPYVLAELFSELMDKIIKPELPARLTLKSYFALAFNMILFIGAPILLLIATNRTALGRVMSDLPNYQRAVALGVGLFVGYLIVRFINSLRERFSPFSNSPLRAIIAVLSIESICGSQTPVYCTLASKSQYWFPFRFGGDDTPRAKSTMLPVYVPLSKAETVNEAVEWLLQSAAIPEVFPTRKIRGVYYVDGGVADNTPILPVTVHNPDTIIAIYLNPDLSRVADFRRRESLRTFDAAERQARVALVHAEAIQLHKRWMTAYHENDPRMRPKLEETRLDAQRSLLAASPQLSHDEIREANKQIESLFTIDSFDGRNLDLPTVLPPTDFLGNSELIPIIPSRPIEWSPFLHTGTLNFSTSKARSLIRLGYTDALNRIREEALRHKVAD